MQVSETLNEGLKRGYTITLPAAELEAKVNDKLKEAQPEAAMKGFRKGKVPMSLLKKQFGPRLLGEAMQESIDGAVQAQLEESGARPAMQPEVKVTNEDWKEGEDLQISVTFENLPKVPEVDFGKIKLTRLLVEADEAAVAETMGNLAKQAQKFDDRKAGAKAKDGDQVVFDFVGRIDGEAFDGGAGQDHPLVLGSGSFIPGFEEQLVGVKAGDETDVKVDFPAEYGAAELAGKGAVFSCTIKAVKEPKEAEINDELAKSFGADDLAALKADIQGRLNEEYKGAARAVAKRTLLDELDKAVDFELPVSLVDAEAGQIAHQLWHEDNPEVQGHDHGETEVTDEHKKLAVRRVKLGLLLAEVGQKAEVQVSDAELTQAVMNEARRYQGQEREFFEYVQKTPAARQQIQAPIFEDKVIDHIFALADISEKKVGKDDLQKAVEALDEGL